MTPDQYTRWKDFAVRMAKTAFKGRRNPGQKRILECVNQFFDWIEDGCHEAKGYELLVRDWDSCDPGPDGSWPMSVCDFVADMAEQWTPNYWSSSGSNREQWCSAPSCCIRAGLDLAVAPSGGVVGFTVGTIRRMYPEGVPDWVRENFTKKFDRARDEEAVWL